MKIKITRLIYLCIAVLCTLTVMGQEKDTAIEIIKEKDFLKNEISLRAVETEYWWPDSVISYNYIGEPTYKQYYDYENRTETYLRLEDVGWIHDEPYSSNGYSLLQPSVNFFISDDGSSYIQLGYLWAVGSIPHPNYYIYNDVYDDNGNLVLVEFTLIGLSDVPHSYRVKYNEKNQPVLFEYYFYGDLYMMNQYEYNEDDYCILIKQYHYNEESNIMETDIIQTIKFDETGRPIEGYYLWLKFGEESTYTRFYYSDKKNISDIEANNNNPIGNDNQGGFDIDLNTSIDSINKGNITINLPEGLTLDEENTVLTLDFAGLFELKITKQENNSWLIEINPKSTKSALLASESGIRMLHIAYKVDETLKKGTYDISINNILFETPGGNLIPEPAIIVPVNVNRWGVDNEYIENTKVTVYARNNVLYVQTTKEEIIVVYAPSGIRLYEAKIQPGMTIIDASNFPKDILFVKGSSGWTKKVVLQ